MGAVNKTFVSNLLMLIGVNLLIKPFYLLVIEARVQERIGAENYGVYFALLNLSFILNILPDLGVTNWNNRHVAEQGVIHRFELNKLMKIRIILGLVYMTMCLTISFLLRYDTASIIMLLVLAFNQVLATGILFLRSYLNGMHLFAADRIISVSDRLLLIFLLGGALLMTDSQEPFPVAYLIYGQTISYALTLLPAFYFVRRLSLKDNTPPTAQNTSILTSSLPFAALILVSMISNRADAIMLERLSDSYQAGIYAMAYRPGDMLTMISYLFAVMLLPIFTRLLSQHKSPIELFGIAFRMLLVGCTLVAAICAMCPTWIMSLIYDHPLEEAASVLPYTMAGAALFSLQYTTGTLLTAGGRMKPLIVISSLALICNIVLNFLLIPSHLSVGVAIAAVATQAFVFLLQSAIAHKKYSIWTYSLVTKSTLFLSLVAATLILLHLEEYSAPTTAIILLISITAIAGFLRMLPMKELFSNLKPDATQLPS